MFFVVPAILVLVLDNVLNIAVLKIILRAFFESSATKY